MKTDRPFSTSFVCALGIWVIGLLGLGKYGAKGGFHWPESVIAAAVIFACAMVVGTWCYFSKKSWSWQQVLYKLFYVLLVPGFIAILYVFLSD